MDDAYKLLNASIRNKNTQAFVESLLRFSYNHESLEKTKSYYEDLTSLYIEECLLQIKIDKIQREVNNGTR